MNSPKGDLILGRNPKLLVEQRAGRRGRLVSADSLCFASRVILKPHCQGRPDPSEGVARLEGAG